VYPLHLQRRSQRPRTEQLVALWCSLARWRQRPHGGISSLMSGALGTGVQLGMSMLIAWLICTVRVRDRLSTFRFSNLRP
jgi:hypothetical protein